MKAADVKSKIEEMHPYKDAGNRDSYSQYNEGWSDACDALFEALRAAGLLSEWISVEERLPESGDTVLVIDDDGSIYCDLYQPHRGMFFCSTQRGEVTHWQPLPKPPE